MSVGLIVKAREGESQRLERFASGLPVHRPGCVSTYLLPMLGGLAMVQRRLKNNLFSYWEGGGRATDDQRVSAHKERLPPPPLSAKDHIRKGLRAGILQSIQSNRLAGKDLQAKDLCNSVRVICLSSYSKVQVSWNHSARDYRGRVTCDAVSGAGGHHSRRGLLRHPHRTVAGNASRSRF